MVCVPQGYRPTFPEDDAVEDNSSTAVTELERTVVRPRRGRARPKRQPRYHVILWNDDDHTYDYVIRMMQSLFGHPRPMGRKIAEEVDRTGRAICLTTTREHAELKRDQIHAFGADREVVSCQGSMWSTIEPEV
jgi:ATP-dependent Clp protease adaptor protein ClpS